MKIRCVQEDVFTRVALEVEALSSSLKKMRWSHIFIGIADGTDVRDSYNLLKARITNVTQHIHEEHLID